MIQEIEISRLKTHPNNIRKNYSGIEELAESIKAQGILQNLTIVPDPQEPGTYFAVIGNRRLMAAKLAGIKTAPCQISNMDKKEQMSVMLLENIQRSDLTIHEQAQGFQMMLDLGETEDSISEKTGFSKTTVRHRLNIAKLNKEVLQKKENDENFQLSLKDLYELEKIPDIKTRDKVLMQASSSNNLAQLARNEAAEIARKKAEKTYIGLCEADGINPAPKSVERELYDSKWEIIEKFSLDKEPEAKIDCKAHTADEKLFYIVQWREFCIIKKKPKRQLSEYEIEQKEKEKRKREIKAMQKAMSAERTEFVKLAIEKNFKPENGKQEDVIRQLFDVMVKCGAWLGESVLLKFITGEAYIDNYSDEGKAKRADYEKKRAALSLLYKMMIYAVNGVASKELTDWNIRYSKESGTVIMALDEILAQFGFSYSREDFYKIAEGTHELYTEEEKDDTGEPE